MSKVKTPASLELLEDKLNEIVEACREIQQLREKLGRQKRGSDAYLALLPEIAVCGDVISAKLHSLEEIIDTIEDAMPEDD